MRDLALPDWMQAWVKMAAPDEPHKFQRRLDWDGWSTESFKAWLCSDPAELESPASGWKEALSSAQELIREDWDLPLVPYGSDPSLPFVDIWWPLRCRMAEQLRDQEYFNQSNFSASVADQMADALLERLCSLTDQVFWELFSTPFSCHGHGLHKCCSARASIRTLRGSCVSLPRWVAMYPR